MVTKISKWELLLLGCVCLCVACKVYVTASAVFVENSLTDKLFIIANEKNHFWMNCGPNSTCP